MGNGMPISAIVGDEAIMREMEEIFFSGTFGGELVSLASANYVIDRYLGEEIPQMLAKKGHSLATIIEQIVEDNNLTEYLKFTGHDSWKILNWYGDENYSVDEIKTLFMQEMFNSGVLILGSHNISLSLNQNDEKVITHAYSKTLKRIRDSISKGSLREELRVNPNPPLFKIR
jgi:glutamate-1-semialdehyde aminotransferase